LYLPLILKNFPPIPSTSYYVGSANYSQIHSLGQNDGATALQHPEMTEHLVVLDIGTPGTSGGLYGAWMTRNKGFVPAMTGSALAQEFAIGWLQQTSGTNHHLWLAFGVNNYGSGVVTTNASAWSTAMAIARVSIQDPRLHWVFAFDAEQEWNTAAITKQYSDAYMNGQSGCTPGSGLNACMYNFGNANCGYSPINQSCGYSDWFKNDIWYLSGGQKRAGDTYDFAAALPEIYNTLGNNSRQWQSVSLYGATTTGKHKLYFAGSLTQAGACAQVGSCAGVNNPPGIGYLQLHSWLNSDARTVQSIPCSTDIKYQVYP
jgi:hypothetical protein